MQEMLPQNFQRRDAKTQRFLKERSSFRKERLIVFSQRLCVSAFLLFLISCQSKPTDLRTLAPAETLVYLESRDLAKTLGALSENHAFQETAVGRPNLAALENVQFAVSVTGFEASEEKVTEQNSVLSFKPRFVAVADTHAWNWQAVSLAENQLNEFVRDAYGDELSIEKIDKHGGKWFNWKTPNAEAKIFAFVEEGRIFFGNDAAALEKCLAVKRGESDNLLKNEALSRAYAAASAENNLAFGYVSSEGIAQISNIVGVSAASESSGETEVQGFIARVLPQILRGATREIVWTAQRSSATENRIEDKLSISLTQQTASVFKETLVAAPENKTNSAEFLPADAFSVTRYNLKKPLISWRSLLLVSGHNLDPAAANLLAQVSNNLLESYGVADAETFLGAAVDSDIFTAHLDAEGEKSVVLATVKDAEKVKKSLADINLQKPAEKHFNADVWFEEDRSRAAAFIENKLILGETETVLKCLEARQNGRNFTKTPNYQKFAESNALAVTFAKDLDTAEKVVSVLSEPKDENKKTVTVYSIETRMNGNSVERRYLSDFGFIGTILEQID